MRRPRFPTTPLYACAGLAAALAVAAPQPASAQYIGRGAPPPLPAAPRAGQVESPAAALARAVRTLAQSPRNFPALINAGHAALDLGDTQSAIGFFGRAEEVRPSDPSPKIGMGAATVADGDAGGALRWFFQAQQLGATAAAMGADRGLAQDLLGNQAAAQADYRAALAGPDSTEARRRLALSLGISGDRNGAFAILQPLLQRQDPAAQRIRAFVLALVGDERGASSAIDTAMPGSGGRMAGFFRLLPSLSAPQKAAAVHLGVFPDPSQIRVAAVSPRLLAPPLPDRRVAPPAPARVAPPVSRPVATVVAPPAPAPRPAQSAPLVPSPVVTSAPPVTLPIARSDPAPALAAPQPGFTAAAEPPVAVTFDLPSARAAPSATAPATATPGAGDRLSGIDRLLAQADELPVPPAPRPIYERPTASRSGDNAQGSARGDSATQEAETRKASARKAADAKKAADARKVADAKKAAEAKKASEARKLADSKKAAEAKKLADEKREREAIGLAGTHWVQLAGGANADRMGTEFRRLAAKSSALRGKGGAVTSGKDYFRLLTGPFATKAAAQAFVNQLAKDGVDGFSWTRTPAGIRIEKIAPR